MNYKNNMKIEFINAVNEASVIAYPSIEAASKLAGAMLLAYSMPVPDLDTLRRIMRRAIEAESIVRRDNTDKLVKGI